MADNPTLTEVESPFRLYLLCYLRLGTTNNRRAKEVLAKGYQSLQQLAQNIEDPSWRRSFLEDVPEHREIMRLYESTSTDEQATSNEHQPQDAPQERPLSELLAEIISQVGAEQGYILLLHSDGSLVSALGTPPLSQDDIISHTIINKVIQTNKGLVIRNAMTDRRLAHVKSIMQGRIRSMLCVPLREKGEAIGVIYLEARTKCGKFSQQDLMSLQSLSQQVSTPLGLKITR